MRGISLNHAIKYVGASLRYFDSGEHYITRTCSDDVLLLVFEGVLRFSEDGVEYEVHPGEYHIHRHDSFQTGNIVSSSPKYLFVHFLAEWEDDELSGEMCLPFHGEFSYSELENMMNRLDYMAHNDFTQIEQTAVFYKILSRLYRREKKTTAANQIAKFIDKNYEKKLSLDLLAEEFHFSKNHIINMFRKEYGTTPMEYLKKVRMKKAEWLLTVTSDAAESIAFACGFREYSCFYRAFRKKNLLSPNEWRKKKRENPCG